MIFTLKLTEFFSISEIDSLMFGCNNFFSTTQKSKARIIIFIMRISELEDNKSKFTGIYYDDKGLCMFLNKNISTIHYFLLGRTFCKFYS